MAHFFGQTGEVTASQIDAALSEPAPASNDAQEPVVPLSAPEKELIADALASNQDSQVAENLMLAQFCGKASVVAEAGKGSQPATLMDSQIARELQMQIYHEKDSA